MKCVTAVLLAILSPCSFNRKEIVNVNFVINVFVTDLFIFLAFLNESTQFTVTIHHGNNNPLLIYPEVMNLHQSTPNLVSICFLGVDLGWITVGRVDCHHKCGRLIRPNG